MSAYGEEGSSLWTTVSPPGGSPSVLVNPESGSAGAGPSAGEAAAGRGDVGGGNCGRHGTECDRCAWSCPCRSDRMRRTRRAKECPCLSVGFDAVRVSLNATELTHQARHSPKRFLSWGVQGERRPVTACAGPDPRGRPGDPRLRRHRLGVGRQLGHAQGLPALLEQRALGGR